MKQFFKNIKNWNSSMKMGSALALGGVILLGTSLIFSSGTNSTTSMSQSVEDNQTTSPDPIVNEKVEEIIRPYNVNCEVAHYFYEEDETPEIREKSIVSVPGSPRTYMLSEGCDYFYENKEFDVIAVVSGTVKDKIHDPTFGEMIILEHDNKVQFIYASLSNIKVNKGQTVLQGEVLATSGESLYTSTLGTALHFEVIKQDENLNPEKIYTTSIESL